MEEGDLFFNGTREVDEGRVESLNVSSGEIFEEAAEGDEVVGLSEGGETFVANVISVAVEFEAVFAEEFGVNLARLNIVFS